MAVVQNEWRYPMLFSNGRRSDVSFWFGNRGTYDAIRIHCMSSRVPAQVAVGLTRDLAIASDAELAVAYYWRGMPEEWISRYAAVEPMCLGPTVYELRRSLPDLAWYSVWGPPYTELFGRDRLGASPAFRSGPVSSKHWELQLTETPSDQNLPTIQNVVKAHLGIECFLDLAAPERQQRAPAFDWAPPVRNGLEMYLQEKGLLND